MKRISLLGPLLAASTAFAQSDHSDIFLLGGGLHALGDTTWTYESGFVSKLTTHFGIGFAYNNDGHLPDNHRDGLAAQGWYIQRLGRHVELQLGAGPYATMNNTTVHGTRENEFQVGALTSVALKWYPTDHPWYLRAQYNNTWVPASFHSNALLLGVGRDFSYQEDATGAKRLNVDVSFWGGSSRTTQVGAQHTALAYEVEGKSHFAGFDKLGYSASFLSEGDTGLVNRRGVPLRLWYDQPAGPLMVSFGLGPYVAYDGLSAKKFRVAGTGSLRVAYALSRHYGIGVMYTRVASFYNRDEDIVMAGLLVRL
jgi:hypothetical protein